MSSFSKIKGVIFDLDGTLIDSLNETSDILNKMREQRGSPPLSKENYKKLISHGAGDLVQFSCGKYESKIKLIDEFRELYELTTTSRNSIYPGVIETLERLKLRGVKLAICTNKPINLCLKVLADTNMTHYFEGIVAGGMTKESKPSSEPICLVMEKLGLNSDQVILVGDSTVDQDAAKASSVQFVFFKLGYNDGVKESSSLFSISCLSELIIKL